MRKSSLSLSFLGCQASVILPYQAPLDACLCPGVVAECAFLSSSKAWPRTGVGVTASWGACLLAVLCRAWQLHQLHCCRFGGARWQQQQQVVLDGA
jgi:hypothetical protein